MPDTDKRLGFADALQRLGFRPAELIREIKGGALAAETEGDDLTFAEADIEAFLGKRQEGRDALSRELGEWRQLLNDLRAEADLKPLAEPDEEDDADKQAGALADGLLQAAVALGMSDVHLDPLSKGARLLVRRASQLKEQARCTGELADKLRKALKAKAELPDEITKPERKLFAVEHDGQPRQLKVTALPTSLGLHLHLAVQDATSGQGLTDLGYTAEQATAVKAQLDARPGLYLCIGAADNHANRHRLALANLLAGEGRLVVSLEHRLHFRSELLVQFELGGGQEGVDFDSVLRAALGMSPDVLFIDDIRSEAEALAIGEIVGAGVTVVAQLRAADNVQGLLRLIELAVPKASLARDLLAVVSRRILPTSADEAGEWIGFDLWLNEPGLTEKLLTLEAPGDDLRAWGANSAYAMATVMKAALAAGAVSEEAAQTLLVTPDVPEPDDSQAPSG